MSTGAIEVELIGGPLDGQRRAIQGDLMSPPPEIVLYARLPPPAHRVAYHREPNERNSGPLWFYRYEGTP